MYKTTLTAMTVALAGVFLAAGSAGASIADWQSPMNVGNQVHFSWDGSAWVPETSAGLGQDTTWEEVSDSTHNSPQLRGVNWDTAGRGWPGDQAYWQPTQGEFIYSPDRNVFDLNPWDVGGGLSSFGPPDVDDVEFAGIWEFHISNGDQASGLADVTSTYSGLPANFSTSWELELANRPIDETDRSAGSQNVISEWEFELNQQFDELGDLSTEPLTAWYADSVLTDTWSGFHLLRDDDDNLTNRGYMLLATNNEALMPWTAAASAGFVRTPGVEGWDTFVQEFDNEDDVTYYHAGVTGTEGSGSLEVVPEPASMTLLGLGLAGFATRRFMSRKKA